MRKVVLTSVLAAGIVTVVVASTAFAHGDNGGGKAHLTGYQETPLSLSTTGKGTFRIRLREDGLHYVLRYQDLEGTASVAHIHLGQKGTGGGIIAFLCGGGGEAACPATSGTVEGVITNAEITGPVDQWIEPGPNALREVVKAIRHGAVYANVHTSKKTSGEIRGQIGHFNHRGGHKHR